MSVQERIEEEIKEAQRSAAKVGLKFDDTTGRHYSLCEMLGHQLAMTLNTFDELSDELEGAPDAQELASAKEMLQLTLQMMHRNLEIYLNVTEVGTITEEELIEELSRGLGYAQKAETLQ